MCLNAVSFFCGKLPVSKPNILVGVSGGSDSTALICLLAELRDKCIIGNLGIAHVNYGLRGQESDYEQLFVEKLAKDKNVKFHLKNITSIKSDISGIEDIARKKRYDFFKETQKKYGYHYIATGHTADDQAETVLMRVIRGCGINGLRGIWEFRNDGVIRPLLTLTREELRDYLKKNNYKWCEDSSNTNQDFTRNWIRHKIIPELQKHQKSLVNHLCNTAQIAGRTSDRLLRILNNWLSENVVEESDNFFILKNWNSEDDDLVADALLMLFKYRGVALSYKHINTVLANHRNVSKQYLLPRGWIMLPYTDTVEFVTKAFMVERSYEKAPVNLSIPDKCDCLEYSCQIISLVYNNSKSFKPNFDKQNLRVYLDAELVKNELMVRFAKDSDVFKPLGSKKEIDIIDYFKKHKVPRRKLLEQVIVSDKNNKIVWIPKFAVGEEYRISLQTKRVLELRYKRK